MATPKLDRSRQRAPYIAVVDDEQSIRDVLCILLQQENYQVEAFADAQSALTHFNTSSNLPQLIISDLKMKKMSGLELLSKVKTQYPDIEVIMLTAFGSTESAVQAMRDGAYDFITKPFHNEELKLLVRNALSKNQLKAENLRLKEALKASQQFGKLTGKSPAIRRIIDMIKRIQDSKVTVLIQGESGTGKELVARTIHENAAYTQKKSPFVAINCSAIPENLLESELFGYRKGAFTGANRNKPGLFQAAAGGTLFLDEIGELPMSLQAKLLRVLQERRVQPIGATQEIEVNARIIAASNRDLKQECQQGRFREDLFYRLNVMKIELPALKQRKEDIPALAQGFLERCNLEMGKAIDGFSEEALKCLMDYHYPGNIRELENMVERAVALESNAMVQLNSLPEDVQSGSLHNVRSEELNHKNQGLEEVLSQIERQQLKAALEQSQGSREQAAKLLKLSYRSLRYRLKKHGL